MAELADDAARQQQVSAHIKVVFAKARTEASRPQNKDLVLVPVTPRRNVNIKITSVTLEAGAGAGPWS